MFAFGVESGPTILILFPAGRAQRCGTPTLEGVRSAGREVNGVDVKPGEVGDGLVFHPCCWLAV